ncbi:TonB-dependent receptor plug domain-containing protein [Proteiniphilum sp.]|uniref:TonB-dependent receptor plug domain-containing protein n=1 Tax=Proteiniphilum sp. TaxID=1926877 RepID=UPI002B1E97E1|nr:TonB-dependent receptor [Proteiniphilum sp.]MEA4918271.1 TonB-dependent receptor [Proteiniphilum sp.]
MKIYRKIVFLLLTIVVSTYGVYAQESIDTLKLPEVMITERYNNREIRSSAPVQILSGDQIRYLHTLQLSDAVKHFSGVTIKDYGGIGGLKTISVRSLGAHHTAVTYNGVTITNVQTGQIDIGRFSLDNVEQVSLYTGQNDQIFMPATAFASASSLVIQNIKPQFDKGERINGKASVKAGSFGLFNPSLSTNIRLSNRLAITYAAEWLTSKGEYPYLLHYGNKGDSTSLERRNNTDVDNLRLEGALFADFSANTKGDLRAYYYQSERGLPGATIFYNTKNYSQQRLWDRTFFVQGNMEHIFSRKWIVKGNAKYNRGYLRYLDPAYQGAGGKYEDIFNQQETYGGVSVLYRAFERLSFSASSDLSSATMHAERKNFTTPTRLTSRSVMAAKWIGEQVMATTNLLYTHTFESARNGEAADNRSKLSPYFSISVKPFAETDLHLRAFYKNSFRLPTFNDLYYPAVGTRDLKPEDTHQLNAGITYASLLENNSDSRFSVTLDAYRNQVKNKIVAYPGSNLHVWTMVNVGKVIITGMDLSAEGIFSLKDQVQLFLGGNYTFQSALDMSDPSKSTYKHQIAYTPRHSGSGRAVLQLPWLDVGYTLLWSGERYSNNYNGKEFRMKGYSDHALSVSRDFPTCFGSIDLQLEALNLLDKNYEIVRNYPMPGRSFRINASFTF